MKKIMILLGLSLMLGMSAFAEDAKPSPASKKDSAPTAEQREKMAVGHEAMAVCLRSARPVAECKKELKASCDHCCGKGECPMTPGGKHHGHGEHGAHAEPHAN